MPKVQSSPFVCTAHLPNGTSRPLKVRTDENGTWALAQDVSDLPNDAIVTYERAGVSPRAFYPIGQLR